MLSERRQRHIEEFDLLLGLDKLGTAQINSLLDLALSSLEAVASASRAPNSTFASLDGSQQVSDRFTSALEKIDSPDTILDPETADQIALLILGIYAQEEKYYLISGGYAPGNILKSIVEKQISATSEKNPTNTFLVNVSNTLSNRNQETVELDEFIGVKDCVSSLIDSSSSAKLSILATICLADTFHDDHQDLTLKYLHRLATSITQSIDEGNHTQAIEALEIFSPSIMGDFVNSLNEKDKDEASNLLQPIFSEINQSFLHLLIPTAAFTNPELLVRIMEWQSIYRRYLPQSENVQIHNQVSSILTEIVSGSLQDRLSSEPTTSFLLVNSTLGYLLTTIAPGYSSLTNEFSQNLENFNLAETHITWNNLANAAPLIKLSIKTLNELQGSNKGNPYISAIRKIESLIEQSPDLYNIFSDLQIAEFAAQYSEPPQLLTKAQKTIDRWIKLSQEGLSSDNISLNIKGVAFVLSRLYLTFYPSQELQSTMPARQIHEYILALEKGELAPETLISQFNSEILPHLTEAQRDITTNSSSRQIATLIGSDQEMIGIVQRECREILKMVPTESLPQFTRWLTDIISSNHRNPLIIQFLSGILISSQIGNEKKLEILQKIQDQQDPEHTIRRIADALIFSILIRDGLIINEIKHQGLPDNWLELI